MSRLIEETKKVLRNRFDEHMSAFMDDEEFEAIAQQAAEHVLRLVFLNFAEVQAIDSACAADDSIRGHLGNVAQSLMATSGGEMGSYEFGVLISRIRGVLQAIDDAIIVR